MRYLTLLALLASSFAYSSEISLLTCNPSKLTTQNTFMLVVSVELEDDQWKSIGDAVIFTRKAGPDSLNEFNLQNLAGEFKVIQAGDLAVNEVTSLIHVDKDGEIVRAVLNAGHPAPFSSFVTDRDGFTYKTQCEFSL